MNVRVTYDLTVNFGNYWSGKPGVTITDDVKSNETPEQAFDRLAPVARTLFFRNLKRMMKDQRAMEDDLEAAVAAAVAEFKPAAPKKS